MKKIVLLLIFVLISARTVSAAEMQFAAPPVPESGAAYFDRTPENLWDGLRKILQEASDQIHPALSKGASVCVKAISITMILAILYDFTGISKTVIRIIGTVSLATVLLSVSGSMVPLGKETIRELSDYGKLLLPVMTGAMAAQGNVSTSGALYLGTAFFNAILCWLINNILIPAVYAYLVLTVAANALGETLLAKIKDATKGLTIWLLKTVLYVFTGYMAISGAVSGSTDAMAMKAAKITISGMVPVVGGILADASEAVLVSAAVMKNAAGIYGILALIAVTIGPFIRLGAQYLLMKLTSTVCGTFADKSLCGLITDFSSAMGLVLAMVAAVCLMLLISTVCFMKVVT